MNHGHRRHAAMVLSILLGSSVVALARQDGKEDLQTIEKELQQELKDLNAAAEKDGDLAAEIQRDFREKILPEFGERFAAIARANAGKEQGLAAWNEVLQLARMGLQGKLPGEALDALARDHIQSEALEGVASSLRWDAMSVGEDLAVRTLRALAEHSPHRKVQAAALLSLGAVLGEDRAADDPRLAEGLKVLAKLSDYKDVETNGRNAAASGAALAFALENLRPGKPCPDFAAVDAEGAAFKLSDYKGKVVLVDFWGFW